MDTLTIMLVIVGLAAFAGLVWLAGYELGQANGATSERASANHRVNELLKQLNQLKPRRVVKRRASK